ncbi:hypothetical protein YC2023_009059 [Brassica napus]
MTWVRRGSRRGTKLSGMTPDHWFPEWVITLHGCLKNVELTIRLVSRNAYMVITKSIPLSKGKAVLNFGTREVPCVLD